MKFIITGSDGFIGKKLITHCIQKNVNYLLTSLDPKQGEIKLDLLKPYNFNYEVIEEGDIVVHLAAISSPDECTNNYQQAYNINVTGTIDFLEKAILKGGKIIFFSSDTVYGSSGAKDNYFTENSDCAPVGKYAEMKHFVENYFKDENRMKTFRLSYVFSKNDRFTSYLVSSSKDGKPVEVFDSLYRNVVYIEDIFTAIMNVSLNWDIHKTNIVNLCGNELLSRKDMALNYTKVVDTNLEIKVVDPPEKFFVSRPKIIATKSLFLKNILGKDATSQIEALKMEFNIGEKKS